MNTLSRYTAINTRPRIQIPADCLGIQTVGPDPAKVAARNEFFARKKAERIERKAEEAKLLIGEA